MQIIVLLAILLLLYIFLPTSKSALGTVIEIIILMLMGAVALYAVWSVLPI